MGAPTRRTITMMMRTQVQIGRRSVRFLYFTKRPYHALSFQSTGPPLQVLQYHRAAEEPSPPSTSVPLVRVEVMYAPWNPADANTVEGSYPSPFQIKQPHLEMFLSSNVVGSEGWGRVTHVRETDALSVGDWVTFGLSRLGTMRSSLWVPPDCLVPIQRGTELNELGPQVATLFQLGGTALRLIRDFCDLSSGIVLQNAGNSGVAFMASQLAVAHNMIMVSLLRRGTKSPEQFNELVKYLVENAKNCLVIAEEDLQNRQILSDLKLQLAALSTETPRLALNAVGGESSSLLLKLLGPSATHVTYGGMSRKPVTVATPQLIFKDVRLRGYWHSRWMVEHTLHEKTAMIHELVDQALNTDGAQLRCPPAIVFPLAQFREALECDADQSNQTIRRKIIFDCRE